MKTQSKYKTILNGQVDYTSHPAYKEFELNNSFPEVDLIFESIDRIIEEFLISKPLKDMEKLRIFFERKIYSKFQRINSILKKSNISNEIINETDSFLKNEFMKYIIYFDEKKYNLVVNNENEILKSLMKEKIHREQFGMEEIQTIQRSLVSQIDRVKKKKNENPYMPDCSILIDFESDAWKIIRELLEKRKVRESISQYYGKEMQYYYCVLHYSTDTETWYKNAYKEFGLEDSNTSYLHLDESFFAIKSIIYLSDVESENGPFSYIAKSDEGEYSFTKRLFFKALDRGLKIKYKDEYSSKYNYFYRSKVKLEEFRKEFMRLPKEIRGSSHFGEEILNDSQDERFLRENEKVVYSKQDNFFIFDGANLIHRGGQVKKGERLALQICFYDPSMTQESFSYPSKLLIRKKIFSLAKKIVPLNVKIKVKNFLNKRNQPGSVIPMVEETTLSINNFRSYNEIYNELLTNKKVVAIDVGGAAGLQPHWNKLIGSSKIIMYEPHHESYIHLVNLFKNNEYYADFIFREIGLSESGGEKKLFKTNVPTGSSLLEPNEKSEYVIENPYYFPVKEEKILTSKLDEDLDKIEINTFDIIKLDIQGPELSIIKSIKKERLEKILVIEMEVGIVDGMKNSSKLSDTLIFMEENGFDLIDLRTNRGSKPIHGNPYFYNEKIFNKEQTDHSIAQRLVEVDCIFFKKTSTLLAQGKESVNKLIVFYLLYNLFNEAIFIAFKAKGMELYSANEYNFIIERIKEAQSRNEFELKDYIEFFKTKSGNQWAQYLWVPIPSH